MEPPVAVGGNGGVLSLQGPGGRKEWRAVNDSTLRERVVGDGSGNQARMSVAGRPRSNSGASRRSSRNGQLFHPSGSGHSSDSDHHGGDIGGTHLMGSSVAPQELIPQIIVQGDEAILYEEMHRAQQRNEHLESALSSMSMDSGLNSMENPDEALQQRLHEVSRQREQLQQAELELRAQFIARAEVIRMQNGLDEQSKQHSEIVSNLQGQIQEREQQIHHLEQQLEERERQLRVNQMETNEAVWAKDGLLREQTNELATLRRDRDSAVTEHQAAAARLDAERVENMEQIDNLKEQVREKDRQLQEVEEQSRGTQEIILFKDEQLRDAQAWMARAQELDAYHVNTNNTLHGELRERTEQMNQLWLGYQRQLADIERYHAQFIQRLQQEVTDAREQIRVLKGPAASDRLDVNEERLSVTDSKEAGRVDANDDAGAKGNRILMAVSPANNRKSNIITNGNVITSGNMDGLLPVLPRDGFPSKVEHPVGLPMIPAPLLGITNVLPPSGPTPGVHQFGIHQQGLPPNMQLSPLQASQATLPQLQPMATVLAPQHHLPPLQHQQGALGVQILHPIHHQPQPHQSSQVHRLSQRPPAQQPLQQPPLQQYSQTANSPSSQGHQTRHQELHHQQHEQVGHDNGGIQVDQHISLHSQTSPAPSLQISRGQTLQQQQQQISSHMPHQQQASLPTLPVVVSEQKDNSIVSQQSREDEPQGLPVDMQQESELSLQHLQQSNQQDRQSHEQRRRLESRLPQFSVQQPKLSQAQSHHSSHEAVTDPQPLQLQQLQHQQGLSSSMGHLGDASNPPVLNEDQSPGLITHDASVSKSAGDNQEFLKPTAQISKQNYGEATSKVAEPVLLDERSLLACLVRAVPAEPTARIRISSTLPNRLGKMLAPLHWHDYRKQFGRLDEFVGSHPELFMIEGDFINLREGAHATFSATTAVAKAAAAAAAVTPAGSSRMPTVAVTPVAQSTLQRGRSLKSSSILQKEGKAGSVMMEDDVSQSPSSPQTGKSRQMQNLLITRNAVENGNVNLVSNAKSGGKAEQSLHGGSRTNGTMSTLSSENSVALENGRINGYVTSARASGYYGSRQQGRKQENPARPQTQEGRIAGSAATSAQ